MKKGNTVGPWLMRTSLLQFSIQLLRNLFTKALINQHKAKIFSTRALPGMRFCSTTYAFFATLCLSRGISVSGVDYCSQVYANVCQMVFSESQNWRNKVTLKIFQQQAQMPESHNLLKSL